MASVITRLAFLTTEAAAAQIRATKLVNTAAICPVAHACSRLVLFGFLSDPGAGATCSQDNEVFADNGCRIAAPRRLSDQAGREGTMNDENDSPTGEGRKDGAEAVADGTSGVDGINADDEYVNLKDELSPEEQAAQFRLQTEIFRELEEQWEHKQRPPETGHKPWLEDSPKAREHAKRLDEAALAQRLKMLAGEAEELLATGKLVVGEDEDMCLFVLKDSNRPAFVARVHKALEALTGVTTPGARSRRVVEAVKSVGSRPLAEQLHALWCNAYLQSEGKTEEDLKQARWNWRHYAEPVVDLVASRVEGYTPDLDAVAKRLRELPPVDPRQPEQPGPLVNALICMRHTGGRGAKQPPGAHRMEAFQKLLKALNLPAAEGTITGR
jgi:hypothetical protein